MIDVRQGGISERGDSANDLGDAARVLRGLSPEVREVASYLLARTDRPIETPATCGPEAVSIDVALAAQAAVREAIAEAGENGLPPARVRALHGRLDRAFAVVAARLIERARSGSRDLVRDVAHDLRSPLNSNLFLADALAGQRAGELNEVQRRQVGVLYTAALSLVGWLTDLIDASGLGESDTLPVLSEPFSVEAALDQVDRLLRGLAAHGGVELAFRLETIGPRRGDKRLLSRVLVNLVSNAIQATPSGGRVEVRVTESRADGLAITVTDSGRGADIERIREFLSRAPALTPGSDDRGWTHGLGLSICSRLAEAADGRLTVDGGATRGCTFSLELPFTRE